MSRGAEGVTQTHAQKATSRGSLSQQPWPLWMAQQATAPTIREATLTFWLWILPDLVPTLAPSLSGQATLARLQVLPKPTAWHTECTQHTSALSSLKGPIPHLTKEQRRGWNGCAHFPDRKQEAGTESRQLLYKLEAGFLPDSAGGQCHSNVHQGSEGGGTAIFLPNASCLPREKRQSWVLTSHTQEEGGCQRAPRKCTSRCCVNCASALGRGRSTKQGVRRTPCAFPSLGPRPHASQMTEGDKLIPAGPPSSNTQEVTPVPTWFAPASSLTAITSHPILKHFIIAVGQSACVSPIQEKTAQMKGYA